MDLSSFPPGFDPLRRGSAATSGSNSTTSDLSRLTSVPLLSQTYPPRREGDRIGEASKWESWAAGLSSSGESGKIRSEVVSFF